MINGKPELATPALKSLLDFWLARCEGTKPPLSSRLSPIELRPWSKNIVVFEVIGDSDFVYTYYGEALASAFGHSRLGSTLDSLPEDQRTVLLAEYDLVRREGLPVARLHTAEFGTGLRTWERLVLPLAGHGWTVDKLIVAAYDVSSGAPGIDAPADTAPATGDTA